MKNNIEKIEETLQSQRIMRLREIMRITGLSRSSIYAMMDVGEFPKQVPLGLRAVGWIESEIQAWVDERAGLRGTK